MKLSKKQINQMSTDEKMERIKKSLLKQKEISAKYGFDVGQHWKEMLEHAEKENIRDKKTTDKLQ